MKARPHFQKRPDPSADLDVTRGWFRYLCQNFQQRALARTISADDAQNVALLNIKGHILQRPDVCIARATTISALGGKDVGSPHWQRCDARYRISQRFVAVEAALLLKCSNAVTLAQPLDSDWKTIQRWT